MVSNTNQSVERAALILKTLSEHGSLGFGLLEMTAKWLEQIEVRRVALPTLRRLRHDSGETIALNIRDRDCRITVERIDTAFEVRFMINLGHPLPMYLGAASTSILAFLPEDEIEGIVERAPLSLQAKKRIRRNLANIREQGLADSSGERVPGTRAISAPIFNFDGAVVASVCVLTLQSRMDKKKVSKVYGLVKEAAKEITNAMGCEAYPADQ